MLWYYFFKYLSLQCCFYENLKWCCKYNAKEFQHLILASSDEQFADKEEVNITFVL